jgi:hypothetical protein
LPKFLKGSPNIEGIFFYHIAQKKAILEGIMHQNGFQDGLWVARFLLAILGVASKKV